MEATGSVSDALTCAEASTLPDAVCSTTMVTFAVAALASEPRLQATPVPVMPHVPAVDVAEEITPVEGNWAVSATLVAVEGPLFTTVAV